MAYFIGPKNVEWTPMPATAASISASASVVAPVPASNSPAPPTSMMPTSATFTARATRALSVVSAIWPASAENRKNGRMNNPDARVLKKLSCRWSWKIR